MTPVWLCVCLCRACQQRRSVTLTSHKVERRDMTVNSEVSFPALCFQNHVCDTTGKTHCKILTEFLCIFFLSVMGYFRSEQSDAGACLCVSGPPGLRARSNLVYSALKVSWQVAILFVSLWKGCAPPAVQGDRSLILSAIWHSQSDKLHYPQPLCVSAWLTVMANCLSNTEGN